MTTSDDSNARAVSGTTPVWLLTIVAEPAVENRLVKEFAVAGATGFTKSQVSGEGSRSRRISDLEGGSLRFEVLASDDTATTLMRVLERDYFGHYAVIAWLTQAHVSRADKFV